ncbi:unnamed protein product, partial [Polarella glacialis]
EPHFRARLRSFVAEHCVPFAEAGELELRGEGHPLSWTELHDRYRRLFEEQLEGFLNEEGVGREAFLKLARGLSKAGPEWRKGWNAFLAEITASEDYAAFVQIMRVAGERRVAEMAELACSQEMQELGPFLP